MSSRIIACLASVFAMSCAGAAPAKKEAKPIQIQFAFFHFKNDRVRVSVNGKMMFDRVVTVTSESGRFGLAAVAQIKMPNCAEVIVTTRRQRIVRPVCLTATSKSVVVDAGPPLTMTVRDDFQGND